MRLKRLKSVSPSVPLVIAAILIVGFGLVYYLHVSQQQDYLRDRNLRQLLLIGNQVNQRMVDLATVLRNTPRKLRNQTVLEPEDYLRPARFADTRHGHSLKELGIPLPVEPANRWAQTWLVRSNDRVMVQLVDVDTARDDDWVTITATLGLRELIEPSLVWNVFDDILLASYSGEVAYQHSSAAARIMGLDSLFDTEGNPITFSNRASIAAVGDLVVAGSRKKFFSQPITLPVGPNDATPLDGVDTSAHLREWVICGLVTVDRFNKEANELPIPLVTLGIVLLILISLSWPFLKLWSLNASEKPSRLDVLFATVALLFGAAVVTCVVLDFLSIFVVVQTGLDDHLSTVSGSIEESFHAELSEAVKQLHVSSDIRGRDLQRGDSRNRTNILDSNRDSTHAPDYWNADLIYWVNSTSGQQEQKWSIDPGITPLINLKDRRYFKDVTEGRFLRLESNDGFLEFAVEPHYSRTTGKFQLAISILDTVSKPGSPQVAVMDTRPLSLVQPVLIPGYAYCIIDERGTVLFHSSESRNLRENLFREMRSDGSLRAAVEVRSAAHLDVTYWGLDQRMYVRPMRSLPWFLVVFREKTSLWTLNLEVLTGAMVLFTLSLVGPAIVFFWLCRKTKWTAYWAWPAPGRFVVYRKLVIVYLATLLALIVFNHWQVEHLLYAVLSLVVLGGLVVCLTGICLDEKRFRRLPDRKRLFRNLTAIGALGWLVTTIAAGVLEKSIPLVSDLAPILFMELSLFGASVLYMLAARERMASRVLTRLGFNRVYTLCILLITLLIGVYPAFMFFRISYDVQARLLVKHAQQELGQSLHSRERRVRDKYRALPDSVIAGFLNDSRGIYTKFFFGTTPGTTSTPDNCLKAAAESGRWSGQKTWLSYRLMAPYNATSTVMRELLGDVTVDSAFIWSPLPNGRLMFHGKDIRSNTVVHLATTVPTLLSWVDLGHPRSNARLLVWMLAFFAVALFLYLLLRTALRRLFLIEEIAGRRTLLQRPGKKEPGGNILQVLRAALQRLYLSDEIAAPSPPAPLDGLKEHSGNILLLSTLSRTDIKWLNTRAFHVIDIAGRPWEKQVETRDCIAALPPATIVLVDHLEFEMETVETNVHKIELIEEIVQVYRRRAVLLSGAEPLSSFDLRREKNGETETAQEDHTARWKSVLSGFTRVYHEEKNDCGAWQRDLAGRGIAAQPHSRDGGPAEAFSRLVFAECGNFAELQRIGEEVFRVCATPASQVESAVVRRVLDRARPFYRRLWALCSIEERRVLLDAATGDYVSYSNLGAVHSLEERGLLNRRPNVKTMNRSFSAFLHSGGLEEEVHSRGGEAEATDWKRMRVAFQMLLVAAVLFLFLTQQEIITSAMAFISIASALLPGIFRLIGFVTAKKVESEDEA